MTQKAAALALPASLDHASAAEFVKLLPAAVDACHTKSGDEFVLDAHALTSFDSSALAVLLECRRQATAVHQGFSVNGAPERLMQLAALYGVAELFPAARLATPG